MTLAPAAVAYFHAFLPYLGWAVAFFLLGWTLRTGRRGAAEQVWSQMLARTQGDAVRHHLPIRNALSGLLASLSGGRHDGGEPFYHLAHLVRRMRLMAREAGGFRFQDRTGEEAAARCWEALLGELASLFLDDAWTTREELLAEAADDGESLRDFKRKLAPGDPARAGLVEIRGAFEAWVQSEEFDAVGRPLLESLRAVIDGEVRRPYEPWYGEPPRLDALAALARERRLRSWIRVQAVREPEHRLARARDALRLLRWYRRHNTGRSALPGAGWLLRRWYDLRSLAG